MKQLIPPILLFAAWLVVFVVFMTPQSPAGYAIPHARIPEMDQGGPGLERHREVFVSGWVFGSIQIAGFVSLLAWVILPADGKSSAGQPRFSLREGAFFLGWVVFESVFSMMCWTYYRSVTEAEPLAFLGSFPMATGLLIYGMWLTPGIFIVLYVVFFDRWIISPKKLESFHQLVATARREASRGD